MHLPAMKNHRLVLWIACLVMFCGVVLPSATAVGAMTSATAPEDDKLKPGDPIPGTDILILSVIPGPPVRVILLGPDGGLYEVIVPGFITIDGVTLFIAADGTVYIFIALPPPYGPLFIPLGVLA